MEGEVRTRRARSGVDVNTSTPSLWSAFGREDDIAGLLMLWDGSQFTAWSWAEWLDRGLRSGSGLRDLGVARGDRVACLLTNSPAAVGAVLGVWAAGASVLSFPTIPRGMAPAVYVAMLQRIIVVSEPTLLLCDRAFAGVLAGVELGIRVGAYEDLPRDTAIEPDLPGDDETAFVQFSSGSTLMPSGCVLTPRAIAWQLQALTASLRLDPERDTGVAWLPLSHDMGFFGFLMLSYWTGTPLVLSSPQRFLGNPTSWLEDCQTFRATISASPAFGLALAGRVSKLVPGGHPLRTMIVGGDPVDPELLLTSCSQIGPDRLPLTAIVSAYGLAEAVLAVSMSAPGTVPTVLRVDRGALADRHVCLVGEDPPDAISLLSCGAPLPGNTIVADGPTLGQLVVRSPSLASGYVGDPARTEARFGPDGLQTGDLGFMFDGEVFVTGRQDDLLFVAGRNVHAGAVERAIADLPGVRAAGAAVLDIGQCGRPRFVALVEPDAVGGGPSPALARRIRTEARQTAGIDIRNVIVLERGELPKTPSGKIQRWRCRDLALTRDG